MAFAQRLSELRKPLNLTRQARAEQADLHVTLFGRQEASKTQPGLDALRRIALTLSSTPTCCSSTNTNAAHRRRLPFEAINRLDDDEEKNRPSNASSKPPAAPRSPPLGRVATAGDLASGVK
jgi:transcriptional regulator with XRE-family HTH domain